MLYGTGREAGARAGGSWAPGDGEVQHLSPHWGKEHWGEPLQHELLPLRNSGYQIQPFLNSMGSWPAQFLTEPKTSRTSPRALGPTTQQNTPVPSPTQLRFPPLKDAGRGCFHSLVWELSAAASAHPPIALGQLQPADRVQAFAPMAPRPLPCPTTKNTAT